MDPPIEHAPADTFTLAQIECILDELSPPPLQPQPPPPAVPHQDTVLASQVMVSRQQIVFGNGPLLPGSIEEIELSVMYNFKEGTQGQGEPRLLRVVAVCGNEEFEELDEYVFSVRSSSNYQYYEEVRFKICRGSQADIKVAVKIPPVTSNYTISGTIFVMLDQLPAIEVPLTASCVIPEIVSLKSLFNQKEQTHMIRVPARKGQPRTPPLPFKNNSQYSLCLQVQAVSNEKSSDKPYDIVVQNLVNCQPDNIFYVNMQLKSNSNYEGPDPVQMSIRKVLVFKVKNSVSYFHFPLEVVVFEGQAAEGN